MREGWTYQNFEKCIEKVKYTTKIASSDFHLGSKYPIISQEEDYISGYWDKEEDVFHITKPVVIFGDHTRVLKYVDMDFVLGADGVKILQPIDNLNAKFLKYYLQAYQIPNLGYSRHYKILKDINVPIPPHTTQQQIVSELDLLSHILDQKRQQLKEYDALAESIFYDMFGDLSLFKTREQLIDLYKFIDYRGKTPTKISSGIPLVTAKNVRKGYLDYSIKEYISEEEFNQRKSRGVSQKGDILFTTEAPMGFAAIADLDVFSGGQRIITLQNKNEEKINNLYALFYILSDSFQDELLNQATGATVKGIKGSKLEKFLIPLPPLTLQRSFAAKIESIEHQKQLLRASIKETEMLFQSRMDYWFNS